MSRGTRAIIGLVILFGIVLVLLFVPVVPVNSSSGQFGNLNANQQTAGSVTYVLFKCGEVHQSGSLSSNGATLSSSDQYKWVCGQG